MDIGLMKEGLAHHQEVAARDRAVYLQGMKMYTMFDVFWQTPIRVIYFLFTPFPWMIKQFIDLFGLVDALLYVWLVVCLWKLRRFVFQNSNAKVLGLFILAGITVFAIATSNYGTALRHRAKFAPLLIALATPVLLRTKVYLFSKKRFKLCTRGRSSFLPLALPTAEPKRN